MHAFRPFDDTGNRRSACDRCRSHKLRCERFGETLQCRRCLKASAECVTGAALKSGRPAQLYLQSQQKTTTQGDCPPDSIYLSAQQVLPSFPTPPPTTLNGIPENQGMLQDTMIDMQLFRSPTALHTFDTTWTDIFEQGSISDDEIQPVLGTGINEEHANNPNRIPLDRSAELMKKLGELQTKILIDLDAVKFCGSADKCPHTSGATGSDQTYNYLIGHMLDNSTILLDILNCFQPVSQESSHISGQNSSNTIQLDDKPRCSAPVMFSLLSCYVCLIRIYRTIFSSIYDSLPFLLSSPGAMFQLFPGMELGGFRLATRIDLQIQILLQVSEDMLAKVEAKFGMANNKSSGVDSIFDPVRIAKTLGPMLEEEANEQPLLEKQRGNCAPLRQILAGIKQAIDMRSDEIRE